MRAEESKSAPLAKQLARIMTTRHLDVFGAQDPSDPHRFAAAMHVPGAQLLVIAATFDNPSSAQARLTNGEYRDLYLDLAAARERREPVFFEDMGADGLCTDKDQLPDTVREGKGSPIVFDGDPNAQHLSRREYQSRYAAADERYSALLQLLIAAAPKAT